MDIPSSDPLQNLYPYIRDRIINIIFQSLLYGLSLFIAPTTVHVMVSNGLQNRARKWLLAITIAMFALSTVYWISSVVFTFQLICASVATCYGVDGAADRPLNEGILGLQDGLVMLSSILLVNYIIADSVVVWRAWVLCSDQSRILLRFPLLFFAINTVIYLTTVAVTAFDLTARSRGYSSIYSIDTIINVAQVVFVTFSLIINCSTTFIIALKAWEYRKWLMESGIGIQTPRQAIGMLSVLVESGAIYILISVTILATLVILLAFRVEDLGALFMPVAIQLVGIYPFFVLLPVEKNRLLSLTLFSSSTLSDNDRRPPQTEPMSFAPGPGGQIELETRPLSTDVHVTFDPALEPGDGGMSTRNSNVSSKVS